MIDGVLLRRAESEDTWAMGVIETACWRVGYAGVLPQHVLESLDESIRAKRWQRILRRAGSEAWVAQNLEGRVLGFTALGLPSEEWEDEPDAQDEHRVRSLFVAPPYWRLGLGSKLLKWAEEQTVVLGGQHILARVPRDATWVRKFYERAGYIDIGGSGGRLAGHTAAFATYEKLLEPVPSNASNSSNS
ncbi:MAG: GNAT family N-acetyltransferase [Planctomycetota bacterium]|nr:GNAT family N-acetyltransferase [Planctomycetota bacterium]MEC8413246.1 GNAT family N-acetyltransferase [Planctomycetota bacterium]MEC8770577.1 GNAT family N-acetyltransferase [Planctomycetota bacterium]MEC8855320.1 GNAT family N-acetyltransferase [Planctomycetota bacterium]